MTVSDYNNLIRVYASMRAIIDYCADADCASCVFSDCCDTLHLGGFSDLCDAACSSLDYLPNWVAQKYSELKNKTEAAE